MSVTPVGPVENSRVRDYVGLARPDHWFKNVFMVPGVVLAWTAAGRPPIGPFVPALLLAAVSACLVASSNYTLNEWLDAEEDRQHPEKRFRPAAAGRIRASLAYLQWLVLGVVGLAVGRAVGTEFFWSAAALFVMGIVYNVRPLRSKDRPYIDALSESINNPLRLLMGWYVLASGLVPPASLLLAYWMLGAFFMAMKRFGELRHINNTTVAGAYRKSFRHYTPERLLISVVFYATAFGLFGGIFVIRYRVELVLAVPFVAGLMAMYMHLGLLPNSPAQHPEALFRHTGFVVYGCVTALVLIVCSLIRLPWMDRLFQTTIPSGL
jgi:4-hydroxybenzoate polyprenyltransferase